MCDFDAAFSVYIGPEDDQGENCEAFDGPAGREWIRIDPDRLELVSLAEVTDRNCLFFGRSVLLVLLDAF